MFAMFTDNALDEMIECSGTHDLYLIGRTSPVLVLVVVAADCLIKRSPSDLLGNDCY